MNKSLVVKKTIQAAMAFCMHAGWIVMYGLCIPNRGK